MLVVCDYLHNKGCAGQDNYRHHHEEEGLELDKNLELVPFGKLFEKSSLGSQKGDLVSLTI